MSFVDQPAAREGRISDINELYLRDEEALVRELSDAADPGESGRQKSWGRRCAQRSRSASVRV